MELWLEEVICGYCPCKFLSLTMELWLEEIICATNFYCNKFLKYMYKELVPIENLGRWIGPRRINGPLSECPLSASAIFQATELFLLVKKNKASESRRGKNNARANLCKEQCLLETMSLGSVSQNLCNPFDGWGFAKLSLALTPALLAGSVSLIVS